MRTGGTGRLLALGLLLDAQGKVYVGGHFYAPSVSLGATVLTTQPMPGSPNAQGGDVLVAKADGAGNWLWAVQGNALNGQNIVEFGAMATDGAGHLYVCGAYRNTAARFGSTLLSNASRMAPPSNPPQSVPYTNNYYSDGYVARLDAATGTWQWAVRAGGVLDDYIGGIVADGQGRVFVGGRQAAITDFQNPLAGGSAVNLGQLDGATGVWRWTAATAPVEVWDIATDAVGRLQMGGLFDGATAAFGATMLTGAGPGMSTGYLARMGAGPLAARPPSGAAAPLAVWPNPTGGGAVWVQGPAPGQAVRVCDALDRVVGIGLMPARGPLRLELGAGLAPGLYVVRSGGQARRLVVEQ